MIKTVEYLDGKVRMIDQTRLPLEKVFVDCETIDDVANAINSVQKDSMVNTDFLRTSLLGQ